MTNGPTKRDVMTTGTAAALLSAAALSGIPETAKAQVPPPLGFKPLRKANDKEMSYRFAAYRPKATTFGAAVVEYAQAGLGKGEIGGDNAGELIDWLTQTPPHVTPAWCAAFVCYAYLGASYGLQRVPPWQTWRYGPDGGIDPELWVPTLADNAYKAGAWVLGPDLEVRSRIIPGSVMFVPGGPGGPRYLHVGIVESVSGNTAICIEGNTGAKSNPAGLDMVTRITRSLNACDFGVAIN